MLSLRVRYWRNLRTSFLPSIIAIAFFHAAATSPVSAQEDESESGKLVPTDAPFDLWRGWSVCVDGDTAVIGELDGEAVHVFERDQTGRWTQSARLTPSDGVPGAFGISVAISGDTLIVGSPFASAAYVYNRHREGPNAWDEVAKLTGSDVPAFGRYFGYSVAITGGTAVGGGTLTGAAYIFERNNGGPDAWGEVQKLTASDAGPEDWFGASVAISDDTILVGAPFYNNPEADNLGSAYVFARIGSSPGVWTESAKLTPSDRRQAFRFGSSVSLSGRTVIIGGTATGFGGYAGAAYIFEHDVDGAYEWTEVAILTSDTGRSYTGRTDDSFGESVSIDGNVAVVGAPNDVEKGQGSGAAYVFYRNEGGPARWGERLKLTARDGHIDHLFGQSVSVSGTTIVIGGPEPSRRGSAYVCPLDSVNSASGACRRAIPVVNDQITMSDLATTCCPDSNYLITATFTNTSAIPIQQPFFAVVRADAPHGLWLQNADREPGGVGATLTPDVGDGILSPGESMTVTFVIGLVRRDPFVFFVNVRGEPVPD